MMWAAIWSSIRLFLHSVNWAALSYASYLVFWLTTLGVVSWTGIMLVLNAVERWSLRYGFSNSTRTWLNLSDRSTRLREAVNKWLPRLAMMMIGYVIGQTQMFNPIRELHDVSVTSKLSDRVYAVVVPAATNPPATRDRNEVLRLCAEGDDLPLKAGMVIEPLQYRQGDDCLLINADTYVDYYRNSKHDVVDKSGHLLFAKED